MDVLYPCSILSKALQNDNLDILSALTGILRAMKELDKFSLTAIVKMQRTFNNKRICGQHMLQLLQNVPKIQTLNITYISLKS